MQWDYDDELWDADEELCHLANGEVTFTDVCLRLQTTPARFRVTRQFGTYRVLVKPVNRHLFEAIDGGEGFQSAAQAKAYAEAWRRATADGASWRDTTLVCRARARRGDAPGEEIPAEPTDLNDFEF